MRRRAQKDRCTELCREIREWIDYADILDDDGQRVLIRFVLATILAKAERL